MSKKNTRRAGPKSQQEARAFLSRAAKAVAKEDFSLLPDVIFEASGLLAIGSDSIYIPAFFRGGAPLASCKVRIAPNIVEYLREKVDNRQEPCHYCGSILGFAKGRGGWTECLNCGGV